MAYQINHTQVQYPGDRIRQDNFFHLENDVDIPPNGILKKWACGAAIVNSTYDELECMAKQMTDGWFASRNELPREAYKDPLCAMFVTSTLAHKLVKEAIGPELSDEHGMNPIYFKGSMSTHLLSGHVHSIYERMVDAAEPFATSMEMSWNAVKMYKAEPRIQRAVGNEINYRLYVYACSLAEGRRGHKLHVQRRGLCIKEWIQREIDDNVEQDRFMAQQVAMLYENHRPSHH